MIDTTTLAGASILDADQTTTTSAEVLVLARAVCECVRRQIGGTRLIARIRPIDDDTIMVTIDTGFRRAHPLLFQFGYPYEGHSERNCIDGISHNIRVPDFAEALHLIGIILKGLDARIVQVGRVHNEFNKSVVVPYKGLRDNYGVIDRCDQAPHLLACASMPDAVRGSLTADGTYTPVEMCNLASEVVNRFRTFVGVGPIQAHFWAYRGHTASADASVNGLRSTLVLCLMDRDGRVQNVSFVLGQRDYSSFRFFVPDFLMALHVIGLVLASMGATVQRIGIQEGETNGEVLVRPVFGKQVGVMANPLNFVNPTNGREVS